MKTKSKIALAASASVVVGALAFSLPSLAHDNGAERGMNSTGPATTSDVERGEGMHGKAGEGKGPKAGKGQGFEKGHGSKGAKDHGAKDGSREGHGNHDDSVEESNPSNS
jgi:hypothetical protein